MLIRLAFAACLATTAAPAETFAVALGGRTLGTLEYSPGRLVNRLDNTPFGAADGFFEGTRVREGETVRYLGRSDERSIEVLFGAGTALQTTIEPQSERTALSDPAEVPSGVTDPVDGFGQVAQAEDCPGPIRMYDGRRAVELATTGRSVTPEALICAISYRVVAGPGHVSPFRLRSMDMTARYALRSGVVAGLEQLDIRAGGFTLSLIRQ